MISGNLCRRSRCRARELECMDRCAHTALKCVPSFASWHQMKSRQWYGHWWEIPSLYREGHVLHFPIRYKLSPESSQWAVHPDGTGLFIFTTLASVGPLTSPRINTAGKVYCRWLMSHRKNIINKTSASQLIVFSRAGVCSECATAGCRTTGRSHCKLQFLWWQLKNPVPSAGQSFPLLALLSSWGLVETERKRVPSLASHFKTQSKTLWNTHPAVWVHVFTFV